MVQFILNNENVATNLPAGTLLLDYIRYHKHLTGTKIGCREGDCGACTVLIGDMQNSEVTYQSATSCLTPLGNIHNKHIVTIEGLNMAEGLNPIQEAMSDEGATQCGFCTPGFVVSIAGFCLSSNSFTYENAVAAVDGNICRCTGYKSIERALERIALLMQQKENIHAIDFVTANNILPAYFSGIKSRLQALQRKQNGMVINAKIITRYLGGGTDLYVQQPEQMVQSDIDFLVGKPGLKDKKLEGNRCSIGGAVTVTDLIESAVFRQAFPCYHEFTKLISSTPIRNIATIAGNFVNASPIGDFSVFFLALNANIVLSDGEYRREVLLRNFFRGYKTLDKKPNEFIEKIDFNLPAHKSLFNFEKVCKRKYLDIATVNTAINIIMNDDNTIAEASVSAGGVAPVPAFLMKTSAFLQGKELSETIVHLAVATAMQEVSPISDVRGSAAYKTLLLGQLIKAHFIKLFPQLEVEKLMRIPL